MKNEMVIKQEMEIFKSNKCKLRKRLDMVQCEEKDLVELLEQSNNSSVKQHEKVWSRRSGCIDQVIVIQEVIQTGLSSTGIDMDGNNFQDDQKVEFDQDLEKLLERKAPCNVRMRDNFSVRHQEKGWPRLLRCLDREVMVQQIKQAGLSSISMWMVQFPSRLEGGDVSYVY